MITKSTNWLLLGDSQKKSLAKYYIYSTKHPLLLFESAKNEFDMLQYGDVIK